MVTKLVVTSGKSAGRSISLKRSKLVIGRAEECDVRPLSEEVSRRHCAIFVGPSDLWVEDLKSRNGTYVNGKRIESETRIKLADGDSIRVGSLELRVATQGAARAGESESTVSKWLGESSILAASDLTASSPPEGSGHSDNTTPPMSTSMIALQKVKDAQEAAEKSGIYPTVPTKKTDSSRDAAAEALKKFFDRK
jgi:pSer/pThr/pTyr-binding forkhead associated (FHA) protein